MRRMRITSSRASGLRARSRYRLQSWCRSICALLPLIKAGVIKGDRQVRFGFHNFRHSLASSLVKLKCDPKTVQGVLRHEDVRTTMQLYAQSDQESRLEAQGKFLALLLGDKAHLLTEEIQ
jgi:integrase